MFGSWPTPGAEPGVPPGHGLLSLAPCVDGGNNPNQLWRFDNSSSGGGALALAGGEATCVDIHRCINDDGTPVFMFNNTAGCGKGPGTCSARNELWNLNAHDGAIESVEAAGKCLVADTDGSGAYIVACDSARASATKFNFVPVTATKFSVAEGGHGTTTTTTAAADRAFAIQVDQHDDQLCLTGSHVVHDPASIAQQPPLSLPRTTADELTQLGELDVAAIADDASLSHARRHALLQSALFMKRLANRTKDLAGLSGGGGGLLDDATMLVDEGPQCLGLASPQGPVGEIYSTHTTLAVSPSTSSTSKSSSPASSYTWFYAVGMQVSSPYNLTTVDIGGGGDASSDMVAVHFSYDSVFRATTSAEVVPFSDSSPLQFGVDARNECGASDTVRSVVHALVCRRACRLCAACCNPARSFVCACVRACVCACVRACVRSCVYAFIRSAAGQSTDRYPVDYFMIAPTLSNGMVLLGETSKLVPVSNSRITSLEVTADATLVAISGRVGEQVEFGAIDAHGTVYYVERGVGPDGQVRFELPVQSRRQRL